MRNKRRKFLKHLAFTPFLLGASNVTNAKGNIQIKSTTDRVQYSVNAYSFNDMLRSGEMTFVDMMEFAADLGLDAVDLTAYYFSTYPDIPPDSELFQLKRKALSLGLNISWTGVRNDFAQPDAVARAADRQLIKQWLMASSKLGASIMRIFAGTDKHEGHSREEVKDWMVEEFKACAGYAEKAGVIIGLQHHNDFLYTSDEIIDMLNRVNSEWFGLILDCGSLHADDPYQEMQKLAPYANYWFIKEHVYPGGKATPVDMKKVTGIIKDSDYQGYVSFESLSEGDPKEIVGKMFREFKGVF